MFSKIKASCVPNLRLSLKMSFQSDLVCVQYQTLPLDVLIFDCERYKRDRFFNILFFPYHPEIVLTKEHQRVKNLHI